MFYALKKKVDFRACKTLKGSREVKISCFMVQNEMHVGAINNNNKKYVK